MAISWLLERFDQWRDRPAILWQDEPFSYQSLLQNSEDWKKRLQAQGIKAGQVVAVEGDFSPNAVALLLALMESKNIVVPLSEAAQAQRAEFLEIAEVEAVVTFDKKDHWQIERIARTVSNPLIHELIREGEPGLVLFSSGSTGKSKAALHHLPRILEKFRVPRPAWRTLAFLLFDHIGGVNTMWATLSNGGSLITLQSRAPQDVCQAIERHQGELLPTTPTFLNMLLISETYRDYDLSFLKRITYGTEPMPEFTLQRIRKFFPNVELQQTYGLTELGILRSKSQGSDSPWVRIGGEGFQTKVVNGLLWVRATSAMMGYLNAPSPFDQDGWMNTQDRVEVDGEYFRILGRDSETINVGGQKVHPVEVETVLLEMDNIRNATVHGERNAILGQIVAAQVNLFHPEPLLSLKQRIQDFCKDRLLPYKIPIKVEITQEENSGPRYKKRRPDYGPG